MDIGPLSSAVDLMAARRAGTVSAVELVEMYARQIERHNGALNAIVVDTTDTAIEAAAGIGADDDRAMAGVPITIKDCIDVAGLATTAGWEAFVDNVAAADGPVTAAARAAGAVVLGKTNVPPGAGDWQADNPIFGRTVSPWDSRCTPGGSTGGGAAAVAAGLTAVEFGSDVGGSIRVPAAFCGIYGHRPSDSLVPRSGHLPGPALPVPGAILNVQGPLARCPADLELALDAIAGPEPGEEAWSVTLPPARAETLAGLRVAVLPALADAPIDDTVADAIDTVARAAAAGGAQVAVAGPAIDQTAMLHTYRALLAVFVFASYSPAERSEIAEQFVADGDPFEIGTIRGLRLPAADLHRLLVHRERVRRSWAEFFRDWDVVVAPITLGPAFEHMTQPWADRRLRINDTDVRYSRLVVPAAMATLPGLPATAFPVSRPTVDGVTLPIGLQAIGPYLEDRTPLRFAGLMEHAVGGFVPPPGFGT